MKIELKNIRVNEMFSEETTCFKADIFINGKKVGYAKNDGHGGCTDYGVYNSDNREILREAEAYAKTLPKISNPYGEPFDSNFEWVIDLAIEKYCMDKANLKNEKQLKKNIQLRFCYGKPNSYSYKMVGWQKRSLQEMVSINFNLVQNTLNDVRAKLGEGEVILNTNLSELGLK